MVKKLIEKKKELLRQFVDYKCEMCNKRDLKLTPHRLLRGYLGGEYMLNNIKMICGDCHKKIHYKENYGR